MKKILTIIIGLSLGTFSFAQNNPVTGEENVHIINFDYNHSLDLHYTLFTMDPNTCYPDFQALGPSIPLPPGGETKYATYTSSDTSSGHPYPIDSWYNGSYLLPNQIPQSIADNQRWTYMKFQLREPNNPSQSIPGMGGSIGIHQPCTGIPDVLTGSGTTAGGTPYDFAAKAYMIGGDLWIFVQ
ncbi:hypothetical protein J3D55_001948 [Chryseobacterium ginsenosidimutans]|uniref:hypothetical protein n=1 Tax=Chryseobacterium ginsenosidimutans TaxID=687846 RepID=UPI0021672978|nr:hypothetical protein [Chryseobacterium ginsenosidimutans]MCS3869032.1 hypothetical protein [Chryseobacterium ginsenosidimutans]